MKKDFHSFINELLLATGHGQALGKYEQYGHIIRGAKGFAHIGGIISRIHTDQFGKVHIKKLTVSTVLGCGHLVNSPEKIAGICKICGRFCCTNPSCLLVCDITGITVCRKHYKVKHGVVVSSKAQQGLWKLKAKRIGRMKRKLIDDRKQLTEQTKFDPEK